MMKRRYLWILVGILLVSGFALGLRAEVLGVYETGTGTGWLERSESGYLILHLEGTYYDMGYQQGKLLEEECEITVNSMRSLIKHYLPIASFKLIKILLYKVYYEKEDSYVPLEFKQEMKGLADATGSPVKDIQALHSAIFLASCSGTAAFGPATKDRELYQTRSLDYPLGFIDRKTGTPMHDQSLVVVYKPRDGVPYISFAWPGFLGSVGGMNTEGICISEMTDVSRYEVAAGLPMIWRIKQTLARARNLDQAIELMTERPLEGGYNFLVGDGKIPRAVAIEMDAREVYVGTWDGKGESNSYEYRGRSYQYTPVSGLVVRTNHPLSTALIENHKGKIEGSPKATAVRYRDLRARNEAEYGEINLERIMEIMRDHYRSQCENPGHKGCAQTIYQAAFAPACGDFLIAFAHGNYYKLGTYKVSAYNQPYHRFNIFELLERKP
jgi:predicted choloylglycine hydrolase